MPLSPHVQHILTLLREHNKPLTAYALLDLARGSAIKAPQTVYRALEALEKRGLAHRIPSLGAYVACHSEEEDHGRQFAVCRQCQSVIELHDHRICGLIADIGKQAGFTIEREMLELLGLCAQCSGNPASKEHTHA